MDKKPKEKVITITADGKEVYGLYDDNLPYRKLGGKVQATRASEVRMNEHGMWEVYVFADGNVLPETFISRAEAIEYEISYLNNHVTPDNLRKLFR